MTRRDDIVAFIEEHYPDHADKILLADGFDDAFIGIGQVFNGTPIAVYDADMCLKTIADDIEQGGVEEGEDVQTMAMEHFEYNVIGSFVGEYTPMFVSPLSAMTMVTEKYFANDHEAEAVKHALDETLYRLDNDRKTMDFNGQQQMSRGLLRARILIEELMAELGLTPK